MSPLVFGTTAFDTIETPRDTVSRVLGGSAMHAAVAARLFAPPRIVSGVGHDFPQVWRDHLTALGIDLGGLATYPQVKTQFWRGRYHADLHTREHLEVDLDIFDHYDPVVPDFYRDSEYVLLAHHDPTFQLRCLDQVSPKWVMADTIDYWIANRRAPLRQLLERINVLLVNDGEARLLTGETDLFFAARRLRSLGPEVVIVKKGEHGAFMHDRDGIFILPAFPVADVIDPTGAGDAFAGGMIGYLAAHGGEPRDHLRWAVVAGTVAASFSVEGFGLERLREVTPRDVGERVKEFCRATEF